MSTEYSKNNSLKTIGGRFKYFRELFNLRQKEIAEIVRLLPPSISKLESDQQQPTEQTITILEYAYQLNGNWLLKGEGDIFLRGEEMKQAGDCAEKFTGVAADGVTLDRMKGYVDQVKDDYLFVPKYNVEAGAGDGMVLESERIVDYLAFKKEWTANVLGVPGKNLALITAVGDSMEPTLMNGDMVLLDTSKKKIEGDAIYCFRDDDEHLMIKRIQKLPEGVITVISDNKEYSKYSLSGAKAEGLAVVGRVVWFGRQI